MSCLWNSLNMSSREFAFRPEQPLHQGIGWADSLRAKTLKVSAWSSCRPPLIGFSVQSIAGSTVLPNGRAIDEDHSASWFGIWIEKYKDHSLGMLMLKWHASIFGRQFSSGENRQTRCATSPGWKQRTKIWCGPVNLPLETDESMSYMSCSGVDLTTGPRTMHNVSKPCFAMPHCVAGSNRRSFRINEHPVSHLTGIYNFGALIQPSVKWHCEQLQTGSI